MAIYELSDPAALFFGAYRRKVLRLLLLHPGEYFYLREIARVTHTQPGTVQRELSLLARVGVIRRDVQGNQVRFGANETYPIYEELRSILKKTSGVCAQLRTALGPLDGQNRYRQSAENKPPPASARLTRVRKRWAGRA